MHSACHGLGLALGASFRIHLCDTLGSMSHLRLPTMGLPAGLLARLRLLAEVTGTPGVMYARISEEREGTGLGLERQLSDQCSLFTQLGLPLTSRDRRPDGGYFKPTGIHIEWETS
jgi:hypothetical protein